MPDLLHPKAEYKLAGIEKNQDLQEEMKDFMKERASAIDTKRKSPENEDYQESRLTEDILAKLKSEGYYDAAITFAKGNKKWTGTFDVTAGQRYRIGKISVKPEKYASFLKERLAGPLKAQVVLDAQKKLQKAIAKNKCYFNLAVDQEVTLDRKDKKADILFKVAAGPQAKMGRVTFEGNKRVKNAYLHKLTEWKEGDCFQQEKIEKLRATLFESGLFSSAETFLPKHPLRDGSVPVRLVVKERAARSVGAGASYYTDEGLGLTLSWKHRNLFGAAENLDTDLKLSQRLQTVEGRFTKPFFLRRDQSLSFNANLDRETTDAYAKRGFDSGAAIKRNFGKKLSGSTGAAISISNVKDKATLETDNFYLISFPQTLTYDSRDNILDAHKGILADMHVEPFFDASGSTGSFLNVQAAGQTYHALSKLITAALRTKVGSIIGPSTADIPATKRFYAGGGGSIRGFGYEEVGPVKNGQPEGGRSLVEASAELRFKFSDKLGFVAFMDAGNVGNTPMPVFKRPSVGAGAGIRYYTDFAPFRFDVAAPLNNKEQTSRNYQFYISIGQAF